MVSILPQPDATKPESTTCHLRRARRASAPRRRKRDASVPVTFAKIKDGRYGGAYGQRWTPCKWQCGTCEKVGYGDDRGPYEWAKSCRQGHSPCPWCGALLTLRMDGTPRVHTRCPKRSDDAELLRNVAAEVKTDVRLAVRGPFGPSAERWLSRLTEAV